MSVQQTLSALNKEVKRMPAASPDNKFVLWFLAAYTGEDPQTKSLKEAITGGPGDGGIDAVHINENARRVDLVQGKYSRHFAKKYLDDFTEVADKLLMLVAENGDTSDDDRQEVEKWWNKLNGGVQKTLEDALKCLEKGYELRLIFVTIANVPQTVEEKWKEKAIRDQKVFELFSQKSTARLFEDYIHHKSYVGEVELPSASNYFRTEEDGIESFLLPVRARALADLYHRVGDNLFALQVRGFLGNNQVNRAIRNTLRECPEEFWFYNNGVTIICDEAVPSQPGGKWKLRLKNPQIINGQQTLRMCAAKDAKNTDKATVLVRVYAASRDSLDDYDRFVSNVVRATNFQDKVTMADLISHHERMFELERAFRHWVPSEWGPYLFARKRGRKESQGNVYRITKENLAPILQACSGDPALVRRGKEYLFEERFDELFQPIRNRNHVARYLAQWWLHKAVQRVSRIKREWGYARWHLLRFMWVQLGLGAKQLESFIQLMHGGNSKDRKFLEAALRRTLQAMLRYYRHKKNPKDTPSEFFRRMNLYPQFQDFFRKAAQRRLRLSFDTNLQKFKGALELL